MPVVVLGARVWDVLRDDRSPWHMHVYVGRERRRCLPKNMPHLRLQDKHAMAKTDPLMPDPPGVPWEVELGSVSDRVLQPLAAAVRNNDTLWTAGHQRQYNAYLSGRQNTIDKLKPGVQTIHFIFSSPGGELVFRLPWWYSWQPVLRPLLEEVRAVCSVRGLRLPVRRFLFLVSRHAKLNVGLETWL